MCSISVGYLLPTDSAVQLAELLELPQSGWDKKIAADLTAEMERHLHHIEESLDYSGAPLDRRLAASLG